MVPVKHFFLHQPEAKVSFFCLLGLVSERHFQSPRLPLFFSELFLNFQSYSVIRIFSSGHVVESLDVLHRLLRGVSLCRNVGKVTPSRIRNWILEDNGLAGIWFPCALLAHVEPDMSLERTATNLPMYTCHYWEYCGRPDSERAMAKSSIYIQVLTG